LSKLSNPLIFSTQTVTGSKKSALPFICDSRVFGIYITIWQLIGRTENPVLQSAIEIS
jgi:hypothetical protein